MRPVSNLSRRTAEVAMATGEMSLHSAELIAGAVPDGALVERCRQGDPQAFARLVAVHEGMVFNLAGRLLGDAEEAKDVAQDVFLQVYRTLGRFEGRSSLKTWIYRIVVNQCHNRQRFWRRRKKDRSRPLDELTRADEARLVDVEPGPFEQVRCHERSRRVQAALLGLSFDHRAILLLREVEGLSCEVIAATLGVAEGTVKSRLSRAREALRVRLVGCLDEGERT
jgi:RNA polymerase sigma-70 factor (ECF subfamily)